MGITGGLGCGKTTAAQSFEKRGFRRLDSDALVRERILPSPQIAAALSARYGKDILRPDGTPNRSMLAERVFADDAELAWLESLIHPIVFDLRRTTLASDPDGNWAVEVPLLFEKALENWFDFIVCVACSSDQQLARLERRGVDRRQAGQRISKQLPLARKIELSDFVLWNESSTDFLDEQVGRLVDSIRR